MRCFYAELNLKNEGPDVLRMRGIAVANFKRSLKKKLNSSLPSKKGKFLT